MMEVDTDVNENQDKMKHVDKKKKVLSGSLHNTPGYKSLFDGLWK